MNPFTSRLAAGFSFFLFNFSHALADSVTDALPRHSKGHRFSHPILLPSGNISDDGSQDMDLELGDPPSPPPPSQAPVRPWSPARAPVAAMLPAPAHATPQPPAPAPTVPQPAAAPAPPRVPRVLRNGKIIGYF